MYSIQTIYSVVEGKFIRQHSDERIDNLVFDSRRVQQPSSSLFFSLITGQNDGHRYLPDAYKRGIRNFVVSHEIENAKLEGSNIIYVEDSLKALQKLAAFHRSQFSIPVIGITGSNGKTIVKEWLFQLLQDDYKIIRSPKSFNSQIGVPLSVWQMNGQHSLGIFEAGISKPGEMEKIKKIINPTIGILTNIGEAHDANFSSKSEKLTEKFKLFENAKLIIGPYDLVTQYTTEAQLFTSPFNKKNKDRRPRTAKILLV